MFAEDIPNYLTPEEYTENIMIKLNANNEEKVSEEVFLNTFSNDPEFSKYFQDLRSRFSQTAMHE
jgi:hypothetical protein